MSDEITSTEATAAPVPQAKPSGSIGWGLSAFFLSWTGLIGLILGIMATVKGFGKKAPNTAGGILGILGLLGSIGAGIFQTMFVLALIFGTSTYDLGKLKSTTVTTDLGTRYTMSLPEKFEKDNSSDDTIRYIYRDSSDDKILAVTVLDCAPDTYTQKEVETAIASLKKTMGSSTSVKDIETSLSDSFGGVGNLNIGTINSITSGPYSGIGIEAGLTATHPKDDSKLTGDMHIVYSTERLCSVAWLGTTDVFDKNNTKMHDALESYRVSAN